MAVELTVDRLLAMRGKPVYDRSGEKIGSIEDIYIDDATRQPEWLGLGMGFLGLRHVIVPLADADLRDGALAIPYSKEQVKEAPSVGDEEDISPTQETELTRHYGLHATPSPPRSPVDARGSAPPPSSLPAQDGVAKGPAASETADAQARLHRRRAGDGS